MYNWEDPNWPNFQFPTERYAERLKNYLSAVQELVDRIELLETEDAQAYFMERLVEEAASTSSIEGEIMSRQDLRSSVMNNLNIGVRGLEVKDLRARAIGQLIVLNRETYARPLTETALKYWHELLLGYDRALNVVGEYRQGTSPMRIVSGPSYRQAVHYEAPPANRIPQEMERFTTYCNAKDTMSIHPVLKVGVAHFYFESIHPFEDGNGRIGRAVLEKMLSQHLGSFVPYSISQAIETDRNAYYTALRQSSASLDITSWLTYYCGMLTVAVDHANRLVTFSLHKQRYFQRFATQLDAHNRKAIDKMFATYPKEFKGGMTTRKYMSINRVSQATATRALQQLTTIGALTRHGAGRSTHYLLPIALPSSPHPSADEAS